jgi:hypothetical protein
MPFFHGLGRIQHCGSQHGGRQHCGSQHCGSQHCRATSFHAAPVLGKKLTYLQLWVRINTSLATALQNFMFPAVFQSQNCSNGRWLRLFFTQSQKPHINDLSSREWSETFRQCCGAASFVCGSGFGQKFSCGSGPGYNPIL